MTWTRLPGAREIHEAIPSPGISILVRKTVTSDWAWTVNRYGEVTSGRAVSVDRAKAEAVRAYGAMRQRP